MTKREKKWEEFKKRIVKDFDETLLEQSYPVEDYGCLLKHLDEHFAIGETEDVLFVYSDFSLNINSAKPFCKNFYPILKEIFGARLIHIIDEDNYLQYIQMSLLNKLANKG